ncbi:amidohydrolase [Reyranella aquatilis]|uniref:Amidohydrolase n=1 Tax=Reyranella aquatilis TaxID=2035356 RepID=A0ABS8L4X6_9HYPH|nr:amidohydrolase family protein [Reyranella aquatilis]MCC8432856.1 amidohydrolase [Reyranella aquatilis]
MNEIVVNAPNRWRLETPGTDGWVRTARPDATRKYFLVSADCHANEPADLWLKRMDPKYHERLPRVVTDKDGVQWRVSEGYRPDRLRLATLEGEDAARNKAGADAAGRIADHIRDGVDVELMFPNKGLAMWATPDAEFAMAQCRAWNDWAWEMFAPHQDHIVIAGAIATGDLEGSIAEVQRLAKLGFRCLTLPCKPVWGAHDVNHANYNLPHFDRLWAAVQDADLPITFHVSTGRDPRASRGNGGAVVNYVSHSLSPTIEPVANLCASGVLERFKGLRFATIEAGIGWVPWLLGAMDEAYKKHHFWVRPKLQGLPSDYYRAHGFASFQEDKAGLDLAESHGLSNNFMWANDYPHHEGTWPHSAEAIERTMGQLSDTSRAKILGLNAARFLKLDLPARYRT